MEGYGLSMSFDGKQPCDWTECRSYPQQRGVLFRRRWWGFLARISPSTPNPSIMIVNLAAASFKRDALVASSLLVLCRACHFVVISKRHKNSQIQAVTAAPTIY
jgi:hypothetical protein